MTFRKFASFVRCGPLAEVHPGDRQLEAATLPNKDERTSPHSTGAPLPPKGATGLQRKEGESVLGWLDRKQTMAAKGSRDSRQGVPPDSSSTIADCDRRSRDLEGRARSHGQIQRPRHLLDAPSRSSLQLAPLARPVPQYMACVGTPSSGSARSYREYGVRVLDVGPGPGS